MQDYIDLAKKNGVELKDSGNCQFCGANTKGGVHECVSLFNLGFGLINYSEKENHLYRFLSVDAHTLQHPEIHGRWNNHFHLTRLHLIIKYKVQWSYKTSPLLSEYLNGYKKSRENEYFTPPEILNRGAITTTSILEKVRSEDECKEIIKAWALSVYNSWKAYHNVIDIIAQGFLTTYDI